LAPHSAAKHILLKRYLDAWFPILGSAHKRINYIDGFAGPGEYEGGEDGSPIVAIKSALRHVERGTLSPDVTINFILVESRTDHLAHLQQRVGAMGLPGSFKVRTFGEPFRDVLEPVLDDLGSGREKLAPTFAFVDPFGFKGIPFELMGKLLGHPRCEVFINIMVDFINRFLKHPNDKVVQHFPETFGTEDVLRVPEQEGDRKRALMELYRSQLKKKASYVGRFDMEDKYQRTIYSLFFASNSDTGFKKMKEAMWSVAPHSGSLFSDADPHGWHALRLFATYPLKEQLTGRFRGRVVSMRELERFVIRETDYLPKHARAHLKELERANKLEVIAIPGYKRQRFTYPVDKVSLRLK